ncbi:MAG TPA: hypothetical protein VII06_15685 [Chloroflexota bacterium]
MQQRRGPDPLTYQDTLRALGAVADAWAVPTARLWVTPEGERIVTSARPPERRYSWPQLIMMAEARTRLRERRPPTARWEVILRLAGRAMDSHEGRQFTVVAARGGVGQAATCRVDSPDGPVLTPEQFVVQQVELAHLYWIHGKRG